MAAARSAAEALRAEMAAPAAASGGGEVDAEGLGEASFVLEPGTFDIVLAVDTMEHTGSRKEKGVIQQKLQEMGVQVVVRTLPLGDFLWLARERVRHVPGQLELPTRRELVLDYVVERKRMDDLAGSLIDGRYEEQKYRFASAGIAHGIYLVEDHASIRVSLLRPRRTRILNTWRRAPCRRMASARCRRSCWNRQ